MDHATRHVEKKQLRPNVEFHLHRYVNYWSGCAALRNGVQGRALDGAFLTANFPTQNTLEDALDGVSRLSSDSPTQNTLRQAGALDSDGSKWIDGPTRYATRRPDCQCRRERHPSIGCDGSGIQASEDAK